MNGWKTGPTTNFTMGAALEREMARTARDETFAAMHALLSKRYQDMAATIGGRRRMDGLPAQHADNSAGRSGA